jgi:uncharacterized membrane protein YdjX (TVP38/TMEM64 family)
VTRVEPIGSLDSERSSRYNGFVQKIYIVLSKLVFVSFLILPALIIQMIIQSGALVGLFIFIHTYLPLYLLALLAIKAVSIVYPPLPGVAFTVASIPLIGWQYAYFIDFLGSTIGASISFFLGQKYGYSILNRVIGKTIADKIIKIKLKQRNQIEAAIFLRFAAGGMLSDGLAWGASLIGFKFLPFIVGFGIAHVITTLPVFYFVALSISFNSWVLVAVVTILAWLIIYKFKGRYFE